MKRWRIISEAVLAQQSLLTLVILLFAFLAGCRDDASQGHSPPKVPDSVFIKSQADFEHSQFCGRYACAEDRHWPLRNGDVAHTYNTNLHDAGVDLSVSNNTNSLVNSIGVTFFDRDQLSSDDFDFVDMLVHSTDQNASHAKSIAFIKANIEHPIPCRTCQLDDSENFVSDGGFQVWAGKVGAEQTVIIKRLSTERR